MNYYDLLGVPRTASGAEIQRCYAARLREFRDALSSGAKVDPTQLDQIRTAYKVLSDPDSRNAYDRSLTALDKKSHVQNSASRHSPRPSMVRRLWAGKESTGKTFLLAFLIPDICATILLVLTLPFLGRLWIHFGSATGYVIALIPFLVWAFSVIALWRSAFNQSSRILGYLVRGTAAIALTTAILVSATLVALSPLLGRAFSVSHDITREATDDNSRDLFDAVTRGDAAAVKRMIAAGANVNVRDRSGHGPLRYAAFARKPEIVKILLDAGAKLETIDKSGSTPLLDAITSGRGDIEVVKLLLSAGASPNPPANNVMHDQYGNIPILWAINNNEVEIVKLLLAAGARTDIQDLNGDRPIHYAIGFHNLEMVKILLSAGAKVDAAGGSGDQPLHRAVGTGSAELVRLLLHAGAKPDAVNNLGEQPLHHATKIGGNLDIINMLLAAGANVNAADKQGIQPIHLAVAHERRQVMERLLAAGANINAADKDGRRPIHYAVDANRLQMINAVLAAGGDPNVADKDGNRPIHKAALEGNVDFVKALLDAGAHADVVTNFGEHPIDYAIKKQDQQLIQMLTHAGAKLPKAGLRRPSEPRVTRIGNYMIATNASELRVLGANFYWINNDEVLTSILDPEDLHQMSAQKDSNVYNATTDIVVWNTKTGNVRGLAKDTSNICYYDGRIHYGTGKRGDPTPTEMPFQTEAPVDDLACRTVNTPDNIESYFAQQKSAPIRPRLFHGALILPGAEGVLQFVPNGSPTPVSLFPYTSRSAWMSYRMTNLQFYPHKNAYLMVSPRKDLLELWWLYPNGKTESITIHSGPWNAWPQVLFGATQKGILALYMATGDYALRLLGSDRDIVLAQYVRRFAVSPDGCHVAYSQQPPNPKKGDKDQTSDYLRVQDVCGEAAKSLPVIGNVQGDSLARSASADKASCPQCGVWRVTSALREDVVGDAIRVEDSTVDVPQCGTFAYKANEMSKTVNDLGELLSIVMTPIARQGNSSSCGKDGKIKMEIQMITNKPGHAFIDLSKVGLPFLSAVNMVHGDGCGGDDTLADCVSFSYVVSRSLLSKHLEYLNQKEGLASQKGLFDLNRFAGKVASTCKEREEAGLLEVSRLFTPRVTAKVCERAVMRTKLSEFQSWEACQRDKTRHTPCKVPDENFEAYLTSGRFPNN